MTHLRVVSSLGQRLLIIEHTHGSTEGAWSLGYFSERYMHREVNAGATSYISSRIQRGDFLLVWVELPQAGKHLETAVWHAYWTQVTHRASFCRRSSTGSTGTRTAPDCMAEPEGMCDAIECITANAAQCAEELQMRDC